MLYANNKAAPRQTRRLPLLLALSLSACAQHCPPPTSALPLLPSPPSVTTPQPQTPYSQTWSELVQKSRARLLATPLMSEPTPKPGP